MFIYNLHSSGHVFICNCVWCYFIGSPANDLYQMTSSDMGVSEMFSLSDDGMIKLANSLQCIDTTHTFYEAIEEYLAQNRMIGLFEIEEQHMKVFVSKSIDSAHLFVKPEDPAIANEPTFSVKPRETIEVTLVFSPNIKSISFSLTTTSLTSINQCEFLGNQVTPGFRASTSASHNCCHIIIFLILIIPGDNFIQKI